MTDDPLELSNLIGNPDYAEEQALLAKLLVEQSAAKRLRPVSGNVPGQPRPVNETTMAVAAEA